MLKNFISGTESSSYKTVLPSNYPFSFRKKRIENLPNRYEQASNGLKGFLAEIECFISKGAKNGVKDAVTAARALRVLSENLEAKSSWKEYKQKVDASTYLKSK